MMKLAVGRVTIFWWSRTTGCWESVELQRCELCCFLSSCRLLASPNIIRSQQKTLCGNLWLNRFVTALLSAESRLHRVWEVHGRQTCLNWIRKRLKSLCLCIDLLQNAALINILILTLDQMIIYLIWKWSNYHPTLQLYRVFECLSIHYFGFTASSCTALIHAHGSHQPCFQN